MMTSSTQLEPLALTSDARFLKAVAYSSAEALQARQDIYSHQVPRVDFVQWTVDRLELQPNDRIADIGCGNGRFVTEILSRSHRGRVLAVDLSPGMLRAMELPYGTHATKISGNVQNLPLADESFETVLAMQMLHHAPDIPGAIAELRRVTSPAGQLVVGVNGEEHLGELDELIDIAAHPHAIPPREHRFGLPEAVDVLGATFETVERLDLRANLVLTTSTPAIRYLMSMGRLRVTLDRAGLDLLEVFGNMRDHVEARIAADGYFKVTTHMAILRCS